MLHLIKEGFNELTDFIVFEKNDIKYYYSGLFYMIGKKAGKESIQNLSDIFERTGKVPFLDLYGSFSIIIEINKSEIIFFNDNSNMHCFYITENSISNRFLSIVKVSGLLQFNKEALCEYFALNGVFYGKTLIEGITISDSNYYYQFANQSYKAINKNIGDIDGESKIENINDFFQQISSSLVDEHTTLSLTGGYDSRLVYTCLKDYMSINTFISGDNEASGEIRISRKVAETGNSSHDIIKCSKPIINEEYLRQVFYHTDGLLSCANDNDFRQFEYIQNRQEKGYTLLISGNAGDMHKDWWYTQDLPFYKNKKTHFNKFFNLRIEKVKQERYLGVLLKNEYPQMKKNFMIKLKKQTKKYNTQSYDSYGYNINWKKGVISFNRFHNLILYAPLLEFDLVKHSFHLPRIKRFFNNSLRDVITQANRRISRIPTIHGMTASNEFVFIFRDIIYQCFDYFKKIMRTISRKLFKKDIFLHNVSTWTTESELRKLDISKNALDFCKNQGYINNDFDINSINYSFLGKALHIYLLNEFTKNIRGNKK